MEIPSYFRRYLRAVQPTKASRELAVSLHSTLRDRLAAEKPLEDWYAGSFLYGSYRRNTAVQPIKDVDICVLLDLDPDDHKPATVVDRLRRVLERNQYEAKTALQRRSVRIDLSSTTLDVVPVVALDGEDKPLLVPDRKLEKWILTHPKGHLDATTRLNKEGGKKFVPFVKIVKAWHRYQRTGIERPKPKGFTLEALIAKYHDPDAPSYAQALVSFLKNLDEDCGRALAGGLFPELEDPGMPGESLKLTFTADEAKAFGVVVRDSLASAREALEADTIAASATAWNAILGPKFPTAPAGVSEKALRESDEEYDGDEELDDEIAEIELPASRSPLSLAPLKIAARLSTQKGWPTTQNYPSNGRALPKNMWLRFAILEARATPPYEVHWIVQNHGHEARLAHDMGHTRVGADVQWEQTKYRGTHTMTCELHRNGLVLARAKHTVSIR